MKITKGALVRMKGNIIDNLYKLVGNTVTDGAATFTSSIVLICKGCVLSWTRCLE